jgi:hypothetical protein
LEEYNTTASDESGEGFEDPDEKGGVGEQNLFHM